MDKVMWAYQARQDQTLVVIEPGLAFGLLEAFLGQRLPTIQARSAVLDRRGP